MHIEEDSEIVNRSGNRPFESILATAISRRTVVAGGAAGAAAFMTGGLNVSTAGAQGTSVVGDFSAIATSSACLFYTSPSPRDS